MRFISLLTAALVAGLLYALVFERDRFMALVDDISPLPAEAAEAPMDTASDSASTPEASIAGSETPATDASNAIRVMAMRSEAREIDTAVTLRGETEAVRQVDVLAETTGRVVSEPLRKGAEVAAGDVLCELDPGTREASLVEAQAALAEAQARLPEAESRVPEARASVASAEADVAEAEINATAAERLSEDGFASDTRVAATTAAVRRAEAALSSAQASLAAAEAGRESASAAVQSARAAVARAEEEIARLTIRAPFGGVLESDTAELGSLLQAGPAGGGACATILELDPIKLVGFVPETQLGRLSLGAPAEARLAEGGTVTGEVSFISRVADPVTRTFRTEVTVENPGGTLSAGRTAEIRVASVGVSAHLLPQSTLTLDDSGALGIRTVSDENTAEFMPVTMLRDTVDGVYVAGLPDTVDVITLGQEYVTDGVPVRPSYEELVQ